MNIKEYQEQAKRTCPTLGSDKLDLAHMVLGIHSEHNELMDAYDNNDLTNINEEKADIWWYLANYCTFRGYKLDNIFNLLAKDMEEGIEYKLEEYWSSKLQDLVKKYIAYNKPIDVDKEVEILTRLVESLKFSFDSVEELEEALEKNINKLKIRYPEKFNEEQALNRDLEAEKEVLK